MPKSDAQCRAWIRRPESRRRFPGIQPYTVYTPCPCSKGSQHGLFSCFDGPHIDDCFLRCFVYYHRYRVAVVYAACVALAMLIVCSDGAACRSLLCERSTIACKQHRRQFTRCSGHTVPFALDAAAAFPRCTSPSRCSSPGTGLVKAPMSTKLAMFAFNLGTARCVTTQHQSALASSSERLYVCVRTCARAYVRACVATCPNT